MLQNDTHEKLTSKSDFFDLKELFLVLWNRKIFILVSTSIFAILVVFYTISLPNIYQSSALLAPKSSKTSLSNQLTAFSSLSSVAGVSLPTSEITKSQEAVERIKSFEFFSTFFLPNIQLENLMAVESWSPKKNSLDYNKAIFDKDTNTWVRAASFPKKIIPSDQEAFLAYKKSINISVDQKTSFVKISATHKSPMIAMNWVNVIIKNINESMRNEDINLSKKSVEYLNVYSESTNIQSLKYSIATLLESQMQTLMLASSDPDYIFKVIDSPIAPEQKSSPDRALICIIFTLIGGTLSIIFVLAQYFYKNSIKD